MNRTRVDTCEGCGKSLFAGDLASPCVDHGLTCQKCAPTWQEFLDSQEGEFFDQEGVPISKAARQYDYRSHIRDGGKPSDKWGVVAVEAE